MDVKENSPRVSDSQRLFFKAMKVKAKDDFKIKVTENMHTTSYFVGKAVLSMTR